jgi:large subunit ribosomal protein L4e
MTKLKIFSAKKEAAGEKELPSQFKEAVRPDLIKRAVLTLQSNARQQYGAKPEAGQRSSAKLSRRRRNYRGAYGHGISRVPRKIMSRSGMRLNWVGAFAPGTVGGRRAHPPKATKILELKLNKKENRKAIRSALSATINKELITKRGHKIPEDYPFILSSDFEKIDKTKQLKTVLETLGFKQEIQRASKKIIRAGKGKSRGRKYRRKKGPLIVVSAECKLLKSARNIPGIDVVRVNALNAELLAPGTVPGRLTLFTEQALNKLEKDKLFI